MEEIQQIRQVLAFGIVVLEKIGVAFYVNQHVPVQMRPDLFEILQLARIKLKVLIKLGESFFRFEVILYAGCDIEYMPLVYKFRP